jgi:hypothetical protein
VTRGRFAAYIEMQRGCNRGCEFCSAAKTEFDRLKTETIRQQIDNFLDDGVGLFMFTDDNVLLRRPQELEEIFGYLRDKQTAWEFPNGVEFGLLGFGAEGHDPKHSLTDRLFWNTRTADTFAGCQRVLLPVEDSFLRQSSVLKLRGGGSREALDRLVSVARR